MDIYIYVYIWMYAYIYVCVFMQIYVHNNNKWKRGYEIKGTGEGCMRGFEGRKGERECCNIIISK